MIVQILLLRSMQNKYLISNKEQGFVSKTDPCFLN